MKKLFKITSLVLAGLLFVSLIFGAGVYANEKGWLTNFTGDKQITESENHLNEIMRILEDVNSEKITAEQALKELQDLNLEEQVEQLTEDKDSLNNQLTVAQKDIEYLEGLFEGLVGDTPGHKINKLKEANDNLRSQNTQLEASITDLQKDNERLQGTIGLRDNEIVGLKEQLANAPEDQTDYVDHLEGELERANSLVETHHKSTSDALEEARKYKVVDEE